MRLKLKINSFQVQQVLVDKLQYYTVFTICTTSSLALTYPHIIWPILNDKSLTNIDPRYKNSDQIEELEYEEDFDVTEQLRKLDLELENDGEASELLNLGSFSYLQTKIPRLKRCW